MCPESRNPSASNDQGSPGATLRTARAIAAPTPRHTFPGL
jgi:hypothetical protein